MDYVGQLLQLSGKKGGLCDLVNLLASVISAGNSIQISFSLYTELLYVCKFSFLVLSISRNWFVCSSLCLFTLYDNITI